MAIRSYLEDPTPESLLLCQTTHPERFKRVDRLVHALEEKRDHLMRWEDRDGVGPDPWNLVPPIRSAYGFITDYNTLRRNVDLLGYLDGYLDRPGVIAYGSPSAIALKLPEIDSVKLLGIPLQISARAIWLFLVSNFLLLTMLIRAFYAAWDGGIENVPEGHKGWFILLLPERARALVLVGVPFVGFIVVLYQSAEFLQGS